MIYLVRQGETDWNLFKRANGVTDTFLNITGIAQAKLQADNLRSVNFDACYCSTQTRARQFCEIIHKGPIVFDDRLTEINCGEFEGTEETAETMKVFWQAIKNRLWSSKGENCQKSHQGYYHRRQKYYSRSAGLRKRSLRPLGKRAEIKTARASTRRLLIV